MNNIAVDIPQLPVQEHASYSNVSIEYAQAMDRTFLYSHLSNKMAEFSVSHHLINEKLRLIYISHAERKTSRVEHGMYKVDNHHYTALLSTNQIICSIAGTVTELLYNLYFLKHIKNQSQPPAANAKQAINWVLQHDEMSNELIPFTDLVKKCETILSVFHFMVIRPAYDYFMTDDEPVYFITDQNETMSKHSLRKFIEEYNVFFITVKKLLKRHSPESVGLGIDDEN